MLLLWIALDVGFVLMRLMFVRLVFDCLYAFAGLTITWCFWFDLVICFKLVVLAFV